MRGLGDMLTDRAVPARKEAGLSLWLDASEMLTLPHQGHPGAPTKGILGAS